MLQLVSRGWRHTSSVYGPGFVAVSAAGTALTGSSEIATRLWFQLLEALALGGSLLIVWRRTRDPVALRFRRAEPGTDPRGERRTQRHRGRPRAARRRPAHRRRASPRRRAGTCRGRTREARTGTAVRSVAGLGVAPARIACAAVEAGAAGGIVLLAAYALSGGVEALRPLLRASRQHSHSSLWQIATHWLAPPLGSPRTAHVPGRGRRGALCGRGHRGVRRAAADAGETRRAS